MDFEKIRNEIDKLSISQRLMLAQELWDSIAQYNDTLPLPEWQKRELDQRYTQFRESEISLHDWRDVHAALRTKGL